MTSFTDNEVEDELRRYLDEKGIKTLLISIVESLLLEKPDNPVCFMVKYLKDTFPDETADLFLSPNAEEMNESHLDDQSSDEDSDIESDVIEAEESTNYLPLPSLVNRQTKRRISICAEKLCAENVGSENIKKIPKTDEELSTIQEILRRCVLFEHLEEDQLNAVKDAMFPVTKDEEEIIIQQGEDGDNFYIIEKGAVEVYITTDHDQQHSLVASYNDGDFFGELAIMYNAPRAATCIAKGGPVKLWALDRVSFKVILMTSAISKRKQYTSFLKEVPILSNLSEYEILTIADSLHEESFDDGEVVFKQGVEGDKFYIVKEGSVLCQKTQDDGTSKEVAYLQSGGYFGELALITTNQRQATVVATGPTKCLSLDRKTFRRVMKSLHFPSY